LQFGIPAYEQLYSIPVTNLLYPNIHRQQPHLLNGYPQLMALF
jgi:hypothetical protein